VNWIQKVAHASGLRVFRFASYPFTVPSLELKPTFTRDFPPNARYLIAVSGGRDSVALLHWLISLGYERLIVCHLNHHLRGRSSDADARFVKRLVESYNQRVVERIQFELGSANVRALAKKRRMSIETAAREMRYAFFAKTARRRNCKTIFVAHHADDLVETFLINLFRGAGSTGLSAMREISTRRIDDVDLTIARPFLCIWRKAIDDYVREQQLRFREDATNENLTPLRNRIRHRIIPYLENILGRNIRQNIWRTAMIVADEEKWIESELRDSTHADLSVAKLRALPVALQRRALLKWLRTQNVSDVGFDAIERVRSLADHDTRIAKVNLPENRHARRRAGRIFLE
jgi:tRNA(Ile)-lysidine synthase